MVETFDCPNTNLQYGNKGEKVKLLQTHLKTLGYYTTYKGKNLIIDGDFKIHTENAVKAFQRDTGHTADGWFGPKTCPDLNKKINEHYGITVQQTTSQTVTPPPTTTQATTEKYVDPYVIDTSKNVWPIYMSNIIIDGINLIATNFTTTREFKGGSWSKLQMTDGSIKTYKSLPEPREYSFETYMTTEEYMQLRSEFDKMCEKVCLVNSALCICGYYAVNVVPTFEGKNERKVTITLTGWGG